MLPRITFHYGGFTHLTDWSRAIPLRPHWRLYWNSIPGAAIHFHGNTYELVPATVVIIPPNTPVTRTLRNPVDSLFLHFSLGLPYDQLNNQICSFSISEEMTDDCLQAGHSLQKQAESSVFEPQASLQILSVISRVLSRIPNDSWPRLPPDPRIRNVLHRMETKMEAPLRNPDLARVAGMSVNAFIRLFSRTVGMGPQSFLGDLRLRRAGVLLLNTDQSIDFIAESCGFCDRYHLTKCFRTLFHDTPAAYRRKNLYRGP